MDEYPFLDRLKDHIKAKDENIGWFIGEIGKSNSWFHNIKSIVDLQMKTVIEISRLLDFDFIKDYYEWMNQELPTLNEPVAAYGKEPEMSIQLSIKGASKTFPKKVARLLDTIIEEGKKEGLKVG